MKNYQHIKVVLTLAIFISLFDSCKKPEPAPPPVPPPVLSSKKAITSFSLKKENNPDFLDADISGSISSDTIKLIVPAESGISALKPTIAIDGVSVAPASNAVQNFSSPVQYTVTAEDGTTAKYVVVIKYLPTLFIGCHGGFLTGLNAVTGGELWTAAIPVSASSPAVGNGMVYVAGLDSLYAFEARNGSAKWKMRLGDDGRPSFTEFLPTPVLFNGVIYIGSRSGTLYAVEPATGNIKWQFNNSSGGIFTGPPHINDNTLYIGSEDSSFYAVSITSGTLKWKYTTNASIQSGAASYNGMIYFNSSNKYVHALNAATGSLIWEENYGDFYSGVAISKGNLYIVASNIIWVLDAVSGNHKWDVSYGSSGLIYNERSSILIKDDVLYMGSLDGKVYAYSSIDGSRQWVVAIGSVRSTPTFSGGTLYIGVENGHMYALDPVTGNTKWRKQCPGSIFSSACVVDTDGIKHYSGLIEK